MELPVFASRLFDTCKKETKKIATWFAGDKFDIYHPVRAFSIAVRLNLQKYLLHSASNTLLPLSFYKSLSYNTRRLESAFSISRLSFNYSLFLLYYVYRRIDFYKSFERVRTSSLMYPDEQIREQTVSTRLNVSMTSNEHHRADQIQLQISGVGLSRITTACFCELTLTSPNIEPL